MLTLIGTKIEIGDRSKTESFLRSSSDRKSRKESDVFATGCARRGPCDATAAAGRLKFDRRRSGVGGGVAVVVVVVSVAARARVTTYVRARVCVRNNWNVIKGWYELSRSQTDYKNRLIGYSQETVLYQTNNCRSVTRRETDYYFV